MRRAIIAVLSVAMAAAAAGGLYAFRAEAGLLYVLVTARAPAAPFASIAPPQAPDYAAAAAWAARPDLPSSPAAVAPEKESSVAAEAAPADVFFIHPTSFFSNDAWNASLDDATTNRRTDAGSIRNQASVFGACCRIFAPRYRQATFSAFLARDRDPDVRAALDLAYSDVLRAFDAYIAHDNKGRPFIIASHSQGSRHALRLLTDRIEGSPLGAQLVAAYVIGMAVPEDAVPRLFPSVPVCNAPAQTGCLVAWAAFREGASVAGFQDRSEIAYGGRYERATGKRLLCVNPLTWRADTLAAPASANPGGWVHGPGPAPRAPVPNLTGARCGDGDGAVYVSDPGDASFRRLVMPVGNYHNYDYQLFYMSLRANAAARVAAFTAAAQE